MAYVALYRRWRPKNFEALVGQQPVKTALSNALSSNRIAHAYLFAGPRGTGKTSTARILAKALNCDQGPTAHPCDVCENCRRITEGSSMDVFEIDAASNRGIEEIKSLREQLAFAPVSGRYKIYIIDEVHMLTTEAFNALLKTLEEPPAHVIFILATTDPHKIPATIHSRCQRFDFRRVTVEEIAEHLAMVAQNSGIDAERDALQMIAIQAEGGMRDALSLLDQCGVMSEKVTVSVVRDVLGIVGREVLRELIMCIGRQETSEALKQINLLSAQGKDAKQLLSELSEYFRALLLYQTVPDYEEIYLTDTAEELKRAAALFSKDRIMAAQERLHAAINELRWTMRPRITVELCMFDLCRMEGSTLAALTARIELLEKQLQQGVPVQAAHNIAEEKQRPVQHIKPAEPEKKAAKEQVSVPAFKAEIALKEQEQKQPAENAAEYGGDWAAGEEYWKKALELLSSEKKIAMVSCAKGGRVVSYLNGVLQVAFKAKFACERLKKEDYKGAFENALLRVARENISLDCISEDEIKKQPAKPKLQAAPVKEEKEQADLSKVSESTKKAMAAFGKSIYEL